MRCWPTSRLPQTGAGARRTASSCDYLHRPHAWAMRSLPKYGVRGRCRQKQIADGRSTLESIPTALAARPSRPPFPLSTVPLRQFGGATDPFVRYLVVSAFVRATAASRHAERSAAEL